MDRDLHVKFMLSMLHGLPSYCQREDSNRLTLAYFAVSGLDILNALHLVDADGIIDWVYETQAVASSHHFDNVRALRDYGVFFGFRTSAAISTTSDLDHNHCKLMDGGNLASTYSALAILCILGDDFSRVQRKAILSSIQALQQPDGSFCPVHGGAETDIRFVFCAVAICAMLNSWTEINLELSLNYILNCQSYDGGFGLSPGLESHGGATYCAIAALKLLGYIEHDPTLGVAISSVLNTKEILQWCIQRQSDCGGFQGRLNKTADACYAFWVGGVLKILRADHLYDQGSLYSFQLKCESKFGGFGKFPGDFPDLLHAYFGICGLSLLKEPNFKPICCELGITITAEKHLSLLSLQ